MTALTLVSHHLCPYAQRVSIALAEKDVAFERISVDLSVKPDWFRALSPLGKVPLLKVAREGRSAVIFESAVILEYLEETQAHPLHPADPLERARHRAWIEFGSSLLNGITRFYNATTDEILHHEADALAGMFARVEAELGAGPWFAARDFSLVDAVYGPVFRYFDVFDQVAGIAALTDEVLADKPKIAAWRAALAKRPSVRDAVAADYPERLLAFVRDRKGALSQRIPPAS